MSNCFSVFVVGASGYIGKLLFENARALGSAYGTTTGNNPGLLTLCLERPENFDYDLIGPSDVVLLTAAISAPDICAREPERVRAVNVTGTAEFIKRVMLKDARVIFFSSDTVYGERSDTFDERTEVNPVGEYAEMKHEVERQFLGDKLFKTIRLSYVFSKDDKFTKYLLECSKKGERAELFDPYYRAIVHRQDVVNGALTLAYKWEEFPQSIINFGGPALLSRTDMAKIIRDSFINNLLYHTIEPSADFFNNRPRRIHMSSPILGSLIGYPTRHLKQAVHMEFKKG